jgi:exopolysaccharide biosynthesis polyprenyl glycosylphosphotransferase
MFSKHKIGLAIFDAVIITIGFNFGFWYVFGSGFYHEPRDYPVYYIPSIVLATIILLSVFQLAGLYKYQVIANPIHQIQSILQAYARTAAIFILIIFFMKSKYFADSRLTIGLSFLSSYLLMVLFRAIIVPRVYFYLVSKGRLQKRTLIVGAGRYGEMVCRYLKMNPRSYFRVIGFCDDDLDKEGTTVEGFPVLGTSYDLESLVSRHSIQEVIIAISNTRKDMILDLVDRCKKSGVVIHVVSELCAEISEKMKAEEFAGLRTYRVAHRELGILRTASKRAVDLIGSTILLTLLSPLFLAIAWAIKRDSEGPVFYKAKVIGKGGNPYLAFKFRSMYIKGDTSAMPHQNHGHDLMAEGERQHSEFMKNFIQGKTAGDCYVRNEHRITRVGRFLRKHSLDELPQLINVFRGEMSLVGPRFCTAKEYEFYKPWHKRRFQVKPGMTGLWQVRARSSVAYDDMVILDIYYIENWSLLFDFELLLRTIPVVLSGKGSRIEKANEKSLEEKIQELMPSYST